MENVAKPLVARIGGDVYIRVGETLSYIMCPKYFQLLLAAARGNKEFPVPLYSLSLNVRNSQLYSIVPPFKIYFRQDDDADGVVVGELVAGVYSARSAGDEHAFHGGVPFYRAELGDPTDARELLRDVGRPGEVLVESVQETVSMYTYTAVNGATISIIHLKGAAFGRRLGGAGYAPVAVLVPGSPTAVPPHPGEVVRAKWLFAKHGRGDFHRSGTSHQVDVYVYF